MASKRQLPIALVSKALHGIAKTSWLTQLSAEDHDYVNAVVAEMRIVGAGAWAVARLLVKELNIKRSYETVAKTLREMVNES